MYINIGRIGKELACETIGKKDTIVLKFSMAFSYGTGESKRTEWLNVTAFNKTAECLEKFCTKGDMLFVHLEPNTSSWDNAEGKKQYKTDWIVQKFNFVNAPKKEEEKKPATFKASIESDLPF